MTMIVCACVRSLLPSVVACIAFRAVLPARTRVTPRPGADDDDSVRVRSPVVAFCCGLYRIPCYVACESHAYVMLHSALFWPVHSRCYWELRFDWMTHSMAQLTHLTLWPLSYR